MMYSNKLVCVVKVNGKVLREDTNGTVRLPFGSEYSVSIKNLHTKKAVVSIDIDGDDVTDGSRYIIHPGQTVEIEGFLKGNKVTNKFKFLKKTQEISDFRGDNIEDGLLKLRYQFEYEWPSYCNYRETYYGYRGINQSKSSDPVWGPDTVICSTANNFSCSVNDNGITGKGSISNQSFQTGNTGFLNPEVHIMVIQLKGDTIVPVTTKTKLQCDMCGKKWSSKHEYCGGCGNSLI